MSTLCFSCFGAAVLCIHFRLIHAIPRFISRFIHTYVFCFGRMSQSTDMSTRMDTSIAMSSQQTFCLALEPTVTMSTSSISGELGYDRLSFPGVRTCLLSVTALNRHAAAAVASVAVAVVAVAVAS